jgi:plastocyanin
MTLSFVRLLLAAVLLVGVTACNDSGDTTMPGASTTPNGQSETADVGDIVIEVRDNSFAPDTAEVAVGDTVTWDFATADRAHDVVFDDDRGSAILEDGTWSTTFDEPGTYVYECTLHSGMTGQITVTG